MERKNEKRKYDREFLISSHRWHSVVGGLAEYRVTGRSWNSRGISGFTVPSAGSGRLEEFATVKHLRDFYGYVTGRIRAIRNFVIWFI